MRLDLEDLENFPTNTISGFYERLHTLLPSLYAHECSEGHPGGFFERVQTGTWIGHVVEHIALEIQTLAGIEVGFGRTRSTSQTGVYNVVFAYGEEQAGLHAAYCAVDIAQALIDGRPYDLSKAINDIKHLYEAAKLGPSTSAIVNACLAKGIPYIRLDESAYVQLGYGVAQKRIQAAVTNQTSAIGLELAANKNDTKQALSAAGIPVPSGAVVTDERSLESILRQIDFPLVVKPLDGNHGRGVTTNIQNVPELFDAIVQAKVHSEQIVVEEFVTGNDYRLLMVNYKLCAAAWRLPAYVIGDGQASIRQLVNEVNQDPRRGEGHLNVLTKINIDQATIDLLANQQLNPDSVIPAGKRVFLKTTANLSTGGTAIDVTDFVHPEIVFMAERAARVIGLDICGIDLVAQDIALPLKDSGAAIIEVNAGPGLRMHTHPSEGKARDVGKAIADMLFPQQATGRIPLMAVTGTNGKTTTTRLLAHMLKQTGRCVGYTTTDGVYINDHQIEEGDCTGPMSAEKILRDPSVEAAVLECARGGMLRSGLAFDQCDVGIVTNVAADHLGLRDINSIDDMAHVKAIVPESVKPDGYAVLNADNEYTYAMRERVRCRVALFSRQPNSKRVLEHCQAGGLAVVYNGEYIMILNGPETIRVEHVQQVPLSFNGKCPFMIENILAATAAAYSQGIPVTLIAQGLRTFVPSSERTPGRMNIFSFREFTILVDYAHNPHGLLALGEFIKHSDATYRVGILTGVGDRRDEDIQELGQIAADIFDEIIIRLDEDFRGRRKEEIITLIECGIRGRNVDKPITVIPDELEAINHAIRSARPNSMIIHLTEQIQKSIEIVEEYRQVDEEFGLTIGLKQPA